MKSRWVEHKGIEIFYVDFSNLAVNQDRFGEELEAVALTVEAQPEVSILGLVDLRNTLLSIAMTLIMKGYAQRMGRHIGKAAVVVNEANIAKKMLLNGIARVGGREVTLFENVEAAKEWLVGDKGSA